MRVVIIGGTGLVGSHVIFNLQSQGHDVVDASRSFRANTLNGERLAKAVQGGAVLVDMCNFLSTQDATLLELFETSTRNILDASRREGVGHLVALSVVGSERLTNSGYHRARTAQEKLIKTQDIPYSIVKATQLFESISGIADDATCGSTVLVPPVQVQPVATDDVAWAVSGIALGSSIMGSVEVAGPERFRFDELVERVLNARGDRRTVVGDPRARYLGTELEDHSLLPGDGALLGRTYYADEPPVHASRSSGEGRPILTDRVTKVTKIGGQPGPRRTGCGPPSHAL